MSPAVVILLINLSFFRRYTIVETLDKNGEIEIYLIIFEEKREYFQKLARSLL